MSSAAAYSRSAPVVLALGGGVAGVHVVVSTLQRDQTAQFLQRVIGVVRANVEEAVLPRLTAGFGFHDNQRRRLHGCANLACLRVACNDRERMRQRTRLVRRFRLRVHGNG